MSNNNDAVNAQLSNTARVIELGGKRYVAGLLWWPLTSVSQAKKDTAAFAKEQGMNLSIIYSGTTLQAGFAAAPQNEMKMFDGAWCLAALLASKLGDSWIGVFDLEDGNSILLAVQDGRIVPGCDAIGEANDIRALLTEIAGMYEWAKVYITDERLAQGFAPELISKQSLAQILDEKRWKKEFALRQIKTGSDPKTVLGMAAVLIAGASYFGWNWYQDQLAAQLLAQQQAAAAANRNAKNSKQRTAAIEEIEKMTIRPSWYNEPPASSVVNNCRTSFDALPLAIGGWVALEAVCEARRFRASYVRGAGATMSDMDAALQRLKAAGRVISYSVSADKAQVNFPHNKAEDRGAENDLPNYGPWSMGWISLFQSLNVSSDVKNVPHPKPKPPEKKFIELLGADKATPPVPWWETYQWTFTTPALTAMDILRGLPEKGFVIKTIRLNLSSPVSWKWDAIGEIHVKN